MQAILRALVTGVISHCAIVTPVALKRLLVTFEVVRRECPARCPAQLSGGWQESRMTRCGRTLAAGRDAAPSADWISIAAAMRPVSRVSRRTEVSGGHSRDASGLSS